MTTRWALVAALAAFVVFAALAALVVGTNGHGIVKTPIP